MIRFRSGGVGGVCSGAPLANVSGVGGAFTLVNATSATIGATKTGRPKPSRPISQPIDANPLSLPLVAMISPDATPIAHLPPRKPISLRPVWPKVEEAPKSCWELAADDLAREHRALEAERMWRAVCDVASARGGAPVKQQAGAGSLDGDYATSESQNQSANHDPPNSILEASWNDEHPVMIYEWQWLPEFARNIPDGQLAWVETYFIAVDEVLGMPVWKDSPALGAEARPGEHYGG